MSEWIHVDDLEPQEGQKVLCVQDPKKTATREALFAVFDGENYKPPVATYYDDRGAVTGHWKYITHWQPLPKTP